MNGPEQSFADWFRKNYPGPNTIIGNPDWHAPKILRAARYALKAESDASVAAAYEAAAIEAHSYMEPHVANGIRALAPADAKAALESVRREARAEALREAADLARENWRSWDNATPIECDATACEYISDAILALIDKETTE